MTMISDNTEGHFDSLAFERFPFITGMRTDPEPLKGIPSFLPFHLNYEPRGGFAAQKAGPGVRAALLMAYKTGSMLSTPLGEGSLNDALSREILALIAEACGGIGGRRFFEPGCGRGALLKSLLDEGASAADGCEPGLQAKEITQRESMRVQREFFGESVYKSDYDCIFHYGVLEHVEEPADFLYANAQLLKTGGTVFVAVPGCELDFALGNFMVLAHEHLSYFTEYSLRRMMSAVGLQNIRTCTLSYSHGILCAWGVHGDDPRPSRILTSMNHEDSSLFQTFVQKSKTLLEKLQSRANALAARGKTLGLYGVPRALPGLLETGVPPRIFDGDSAKHGAYFSGSPNPVEPPDELIQNPVDELWILPIHHDRAIRDYLDDEILPNAKISVLSVMDFAKMIRDNRLPESTYV